MELIQGGSNTITLRCNEAIAYHRKLLTNFVGIKETDYYHSDYMSVFSTPEEINLGFLAKPINYSAYTEDDKFSPVKMLDFFEQILEEIDNGTVNQCNRASL